MSRPVESLQILSSEIYDSPKAFCARILQNAYDAVLMRCTAQDLPIAERRIEITIRDQQLSVKDDGIGMTEDVLKNNFWKAGSSGKKSESVKKDLESLAHLALVQWRTSAFAQGLACRNPTS